MRINHRVNRTKLSFSMAHLISFKVYTLYPPNKLNIIPAKIDLDGITFLEILIVNQQIIANKHLYYAYIIKL